MKEIIERNEIRFIVCTHSGAQGFYRGLWRPYRPKGEKIFYLNFVLPCDFYRDYEGGWGMGAHGKKNFLAETEWLHVFPFFSFYHFCL